ncbi:MAG TPA: rhomboid family intramembrane serine protease [Solirubrobacteraceae bacterium]|nr:rhomboid family intramembrane serine protease [Solirubrobacteraceae bacterium]
MKNKLPVASRQEQREGLTLLAGIVALMWIIEVIDAADGYGLRTDGIYPRNLDRLWGIFTAPFIHANFSPHLLDNTIPLVFMGVIIALRGAVRLAIITAIVIVIGGLGTWLISPGGSVTIGASGVVFGYATYLFARGFFDRNLIELLIGVIVGVIWGGALLSSLVPHTGISWEGHASGAVAGVIAAWFMARHDERDQLAPASPAALRS